MRRGLIQPSLDETSRLLCMSVATQRRVHAIEALVTMDPLGLSVIAHVTAVPPPEGLQRDCPKMGHDLETNGIHRHERVHGVDPSLRGHRHRFEGSDSDRRKR
jgi:hypothetical protein